MVSIDDPSTSADKTKQEQTYFLSKMTLHAPQSPVLQPSLVPVRFKSFLSTSKRVSSGLHKNSKSSLFIETLMCNFFNFFSCPLMSK